MSYQQLGRSVENENYRSSPESLNLPEPGAATSLRSDIVKKTNYKSGHFVLVDLQPPGSRSSSNLPGHGLQYDEDVC